jgi:hypothetical protein
MRLLIASLAALAAVAFAAPSFAQDESAPASAPVPTAKPKPGTAAYCQSLKSASSRSSCLKKLSAKSSTPKATTTAAKKKKKPTTTPTTAKPQPDVGQLAPPAAAPATPAPSSGTVAVPPLPSKTI